MVSKKKQPARRRSPARAARRPTQLSADHQRLLDLAETQEVLLPELAARLAALEHLLVDLQLCSHDDLVAAREFVDLRRSKS